MQIIIKKPVYIMFVIIRAFLWNISGSFARNAEIDTNYDALECESIKFISNSALKDKINSCDERLKNKSGDINALASANFGLSLLHRDTQQNTKSIKGEQARMLKRLLYPKHSFV